MVAAQQEIFSDGFESQTTCQWSVTVPAVSCPEYTLARDGFVIGFDAVYPHGVYANGDLWMVGPVTFIQVSHESTAEIVDGHVGIMINPRVGVTQGYDSRIPGYDAFLAVQTPFTASPGDSVVLTTSLEEIGGNEGTYLADAVVVTIVDVAQPAERFRPPYCRPTRYEASEADPLLFSTQDLRWELLPSLPIPASAPSMEHSEELVARVWLDHWLGGGFLSSRIHPLNNMRDYGRDIAASESEVALQLVFGYPQAEKAALLVSMVQIGIDFYGLVLDSGVWYADGGHNSGRKFPIIFAGVILGSDEMTGITRGFVRTNTSGGFSGYQYRFGEDGQTYYFDDGYLPEFANSLTNERSPGPAGGNIFRVRGERGWIDKTHGGPGDPALWRISEWTLAGAYVAEHEHLDLADWQDFAGGSDSHPKFDSYRRCCTAKAWVGFGLALNLMGEDARVAWGHNAFFDYLYRFMEQDDTTALLAFEARYEREYGARQGSSLTQLADEVWAYAVANDLYTTYLY